MEPARKIVHVDMDAFYASVEQRDDPALRGRPVVVAHRSSRSVICAASYEARRSGVRSAMRPPPGRAALPRGGLPAACLSPLQSRFREVRAILLRHTDLIEPLSLDELTWKIPQHVLDGEIESRHAAFMQQLRDGLLSSDNVSQIDIKEDQQPPVAVAMWERGGRYRRASKGGGKVGIF